MLRQAITTRFHGPTNTRGARITARAEAGRITFPYDHHMGPTENHKHAAREFAKRFEWGGRLVTGGAHDGDMVHVFLNWED